MEPPVCEPIAPKHMPTASAAAEPLLEPPGVRSAFQGLRVTGGSKLANAVVTVLPRKIAPACRSRSTTGASARAMALAQRFDPAAVGPGTRLRLGGAVIEVTRPRTGCGRFEHIQGRPVAATVGRIGVMAKVVTGGAVRARDAVVLLTGGG